MPTRGEGGLGPPKRRKRQPTRAAKQATVWAAEQNLKPWEVKPPPPSAPISDVGMETRRPRARAPYKAPPPKPPPSLNTRYRKALLAPVSTAARKQLADTMTPRRRAEYHQSYKPLPRRTPQELWEYQKTEAGFRPGGIDSDFLRNVSSGLKGVLSGIPAIASAVNQAALADINDPDRSRFPGSHLYDLAGQMSADTLLGIHRAVGSPTLEHPFQPGRAGHEFYEHPVESLLSIGALVAPPLRGTSVGKLTSSFLRENPGMSTVKAASLARKESYRPGYAAAQGIRGGIEPRTLTARVEGGGGRAAAGKPLASTPLGRAGQRVYDRHSARLDPNKTLTGRFAEQNRAVKQIAKRENEAVERAQLLVQQTTKDISRYVKGTRMERLAAFMGTDLGKQRARAAGVVYGLQGPEREAARATLQAARDDLQQILNTGGKEIPGKARLTITKRMDKLDQQLDKLGLGVDENAPLWADARNVMHESGMDANQIDTAIELEKHAARVWAREKPGRNPSDYLASPEGRNMAAFLRQLPEDGLHEVLFQRAGYSTDLVRRAVTPEVQAGDLLHQPQGFEPLTVMGVNSKGLTVARDAQGVDHTLTPEEVAQFQHQSLQPGQRVAIQDATGTVMAVSPESQTVTVVADAGSQVVWPMDRLQPPRTAPFYSKLTQTVIEKMPDKMGVNDLEGFLLGKQVKKEEILWSGLSDFLEVKRAANEKSVSKQELLDWIDNKSPFNLNELYLSPEGGYGTNPRWGREGLTTRPHDPDYREVVVTLGGPEIFTHGHWSGVSNPIFHIRFILDHETRTVYINEIQSDWHGTIRMAKRQGAVIRDPHVSDEAWRGEIDKLVGEANDILDKNKAFQMKALGIPEKEHYNWSNTPIRDLTDSLNRKTTQNVHDAHPTSGYAEINEANREALARLHATDEWKQLEKLNRIEHRLLTRAQSWQHQANSMQYAKAAAPLAGDKWRQMVLKWAVAKAVEEGYNKVAWDAGVVQAVRYHHHDVGADDYDDYAPDPPEPSDFERMYTEASIDFVPPRFPTYDQLNIYGERSDPLRSGMMDETYRMDVLPSDYLTVGERFTPDSGPLQGQLVTLVDEVDDEHVKLRPTGITRIHFSGTAEDVNSSYGEWERTTTYADPGTGGVRNEYSSFYGQLDSPSDHLDDLGISTEMDWINDFDRDAQSNQEWQTDDGAYEDALADHEDQYGSRGGHGTTDPEEINQADVWHESNTHAQLYDEPRQIEGKKQGGLLHGDVRDLFKKYKAEVVESRRHGKYTAEGKDWESEEGPIKVWEFEISPEMEADVRKGQTLFQTSEGVPLGASWKNGPEARRMVALLQDANVSTWVHEMVGHGTDELSRRFPEQWAGVEKAMKKPLDQWGTKEHERFATWSERYFREGKAPTPEAAPLLAELKRWLREVYQSILALGRPIPKEARDLLDSYLGKKGEGSVFSEEEQAILKERGELHGRRQELIKAERDRNLAQPDADMVDRAHTLMVDGEPPEQQAAYSEIANRRKGKRGEGKSSEEQRLLQRQIKWLDDAIREADDPESGFADALGAVTTLSEQADSLFRETILDMAPEEARPGIEEALMKRRNILVNRWREKGLLPYGTGDALGYFPHASIFESLGEGLKGPVRQPQGSRRVIGKTQVSKQALRKGTNLLRLYQGGRLNVDPRILLNTVNARLRLLQTRQARDTLWEMGRPVKSEADVEPGWWVINREGKHVPERLRRAQELSDEQMDDLVASGEDFDSNLETNKGMDDFLTDYASSFARPADDVPNEWWKAGELRAVPPEIVDGLLPKPFQSKPGGKLPTTVGLLNAAARFATILQYPIGYILSNVPANLLMQGLTHPSALLRDNPRALALRKRNPKLYQQLAQVAGDILAEAGLPEYYPRSQGRYEAFERGVTRFQKGVAQKYGEVADTPFRVGTLMGYARRYGIKDDAGLAKLVKGEGHMGDLRDTLGQKTRDDLIDFNTLTQAEKETVARYFFLWPLVRGMVKWPVTFARDHPIAAATIAQAGQDEFQKDTGYGKLGTASQRSLRHLNIVPLGGKRAIDIRSTNPLGGLENIMSLLAVPEQLGRGDVGALRDAVAAMTIPQLSELLRDNPRAQSIFESSIPGLKYGTSSLGKSRGSKIWKRDKWWNYMLERNVRFLPEEVDAAEMRSQADRERRQQTGTTVAEERSDAEYDALPRILKRSGITDPDRIKAINNGFEAYNYVSSRTRDLDDAGRVRLVNQAIRQFYPQSAGALREASTMSKAEQKAYYNSVRNDIYQVHRDVIQRGEQLGLLETG